MLRALPFSRHGPSARRNAHRQRPDAGGVLPLFVVVLVALLGMMALAVDIGFAFTARSEAQRVSDSSALAGASIFLDESGLTAVPEAKRRAKEYAARNYVRGEYVDTTFVSTSTFTNDDGEQVFQDVTEGMTVQVIPGEYKVRVWVRREGLNTWFGRILGQDLLDVEAMAAAVASEGGTADQCVLPFAVPDIWADLDDDLNLNGYPDEDEDWIYDPAVDDYRPWNGVDCLVCDNGTGYGSNYRDHRNGIDVDDVGTRMWIKSGPPGQSGGGSGGDSGGMDDPVGPGNFMLWQMPDPEQNCEEGRAGATWVRENILGCNSCPIGVGAEYTYETQTGNIASIRQEMEEIMAADPDAEWRDGEVYTPDYEDPFDSPRVRIVPLWAPGQDLQGHSTVEFNNFARIFIEGGAGQGNDFAIYARFVGRIAGGPEGPETGPLVRYLRLVE